MWALQAGSGRPVLPHGRGWLPPRPSCAHPGRWGPGPGTEGGLAVLQMSHAATSAFCRSIKLQCELYPSREVAICLDPYCGLGFVLWCLCR